MFKSEFAREFCRSDLARSLSNVALNTPQEEEEEEEEVGVGEDGQDWGSHHSFKQILEMTEKTIGSHLQTARRVSQASSLSSDPLARLELENHQLRRQLELLGRPRPGPDMDSKFSSLATEVVRLQNTVSQVEISYHMMDRLTSPHLFLDGAEQAVLREFYPAAGQHPGVALQPAPRLLLYHQTLRGHRQLRLRPEQEEQRPLQSHQGGDQYQ